MSPHPHASQPDPIKRRGLMLVLSSPSGAGKTTLARRLLQSDDHLSMSVSATTRPPRDGEIEGKDYFFVSELGFNEMVDGDEFLEHATVFGNSYGTPRAPVEEALQAGRDVLFDIDWQGTQQLRETADQDLVTVFVLPPSMEALESRLRTRAKDPEDVVQSRMAKAAGEITHHAEYDYVLINDDLDETFDRLVTILRAERHRQFRQKGMAAFVSAMISN